MAESGPQYGKLFYGYAMMAMGGELASKRGRDQVCLLLVSPAASCFSSVYSPVPQGIALVIPPKKHSSASYGNRAGQNNGAVSSSPWKSWVRVKTAHTSLLPFSLFPCCKKKVFQTAKQDKYQSILWLMALSSSYLSSGHSWIRKTFVLGSLLCKELELLMPTLFWISGASFCGAESIKVRRKK